jgi:hypothetical protein
VEWVALERKIAAKGERGKERKIWVERRERECKVQAEG